MIHQIVAPSFPLNSLEPWFDATTLELHVHKHHQGYADKLNALLESDEARSLKLEDRKLEELLTSNFRLPTSQAIKNMAGGVFNHNFFWSLLSPEPNQPVPEIFQSLIPKFTESATKLFGSGWTWLTLSKVEGLEIINLPNQDNPISLGKTPILALDLWEHSYYLKYQNRRPEYIEAFWHLVNWRQVSQLHQQSLA